MPSNDPHFANVAVLLHMDDLALSDVKGHTASKNYTVARSAQQSKWGGYSALFNGGYLNLAASSEWFFGTGAFTIECWVYITANSDLDGSNFRNAQLWTNMSTSYGGFGFQIVGNASTTGTGIGWEDKYGGSNIGASWATTISQNAWHHVAVCREAAGANLYLCLDGTVQTSAITGGGSRSLGSSAYAAQIGGQPNVTNWFRYLRGHIEDFRITKGVARYTANYTPPAAPFPDYGRFVAGTLTEDTPHTEFRVRAFRLDTGALLNEVIATGSAYEVPCCPVPGRVDFTGPVIVVAHPRMGMQWTARTQKFVGDYVVPTSPADTPYVYKCTSVGLTDLYSASVKVLCHFEGTDDSTTGFIDETGRTMTPSGNVKHENTQKKFGSTAAYFDGTGDYISWSTGDDSFAFGGDFTVECWVYFTASRAHTIFDQRASASATGFVLATDSSPTFAIRAFGRANPLIFLIVGSEGRHYKEVMAAPATDGVAERIRGGGCWGKASFKRCNNSCWSGLGWVWRGRIKWRPSVVGRCTSTIWIADSFSRIALGVNPGASWRAWNFSVTCRQ
jgi:hypothetical protein